MKWSYGENQIFGRFTQKNVVVSYYRRHMTHILITRMWHLVFLKLEIAHDDETNFDFVSAIFNAISEVKND